MYGGVPEEARHLLNGLIARGHEVALCAMCRWLASSARRITR
jgi:hypothetical protein